MFVVAGVTGHVGSVVARALLAQKQPVRVLVRSADKGKAWLSEGAEVAVAALDDSAALGAALRGARGFFTLLPPDFTASDLFAAQRKTADAIAAAVKASGVPHVVMLSSLGADLAEGTGPIKGLHYLETVLRATGARLSALRAGSFQENVGNSLAAARNAGIYPNFGLPHDYAMPYIATRDIGELAARCLVQPAAGSEVVDLIGPAYSLQQIVEKLGAALGKKIAIVDVPPEARVDAMQKAGIPSAMARGLDEMYTAAGQGKLAPHGDRLEHGKREIDEVIRTLTAS